MTERWHRTSALAGLPGMPNGLRPIRLHGPRRGWVCREVPWGSRTVLEWLESSLPPDTQAALRSGGGEDSSPHLFPVDAAEPGESCSSLELSPSLFDEGRGAVADARVEIVTAFDRWRRGRGLALVPALKAWTAIYKDTGAGVSDETRARVRSVAWNTLQRWRGLFRAQGVAGLLPGAGGRTSAIDADAEIRETVEALLFERPHHVTARQIRRTLAAKFPDRGLPALRTIQHWVARWRVENAHALSAVADPDGHRSARMPAFGSEAAAADGLNALWELDSTKIDVICADGRRHALIAGIDVWSRRAKALVAPTSKSTAIAALLRRCLLDWGVPAAVKTDEGADYTSVHIRRVVADLGVEHVLCPPYRPDKKPHVERFIGTMSRDLFSQLAGFAGHDVGDREKIRSRKSFAARRGERPTETFRCDLTAEELQARIDAWCDDLYGREPHAGLGGQSPYVRAASWGGGRRRVDERGLDVLLAPAAGDGWRTVNKKGIHVDGGQYIAAELGRFMRQRVQVRQDPGDYGRIFVFDPDGRFVCIAEDPLRTGIDRREVAARARAIEAREASAARKRARTLAGATQPSAAMDLVLAHAAAEAEQVVAFPARSEVHRTGALDAAAEAEDAADAADAPPERRTGTGGNNIEVLKRFYLEGKHD